MLSRNFEFVEKDDVPYAIERVGGRVFRMCGRPMAKCDETSHYGKNTRNTRKPHARTHEPQQQHDTGFMGSDVCTFGAHEHTQFTNATAKVNF